MDNVTDPWPELTLSAWGDTLATFHMWLQIVGKVRLALEPMINHWWQVPLYVSARGLTTSLMHSGNTGVDIEFDLVNHRLEVRTAGGSRGQVSLEPRSVASFYEATMSLVEELGVPVRILPKPQEVIEAIPFPDDEQHHSYDSGAVHRFWLALVQAHRVMTRFRGGFVGKASPVHLFWGGPDLAVTALLRPAGAKAPRRRAQLRRLGSGTGLQPRGVELRLLARRQCRGVLLFLRLPSTLRLRGLAGETRRCLLRQ